MCDIIIEYMKTRLRSLFISFIALFLSASFLSTPVFATPEPSTNSDSSETTTVENEDDGKTVLQRIDEAKKAEASKSEEETQPQNVYVEVPEAEDTANLINDLILKSQQILANHPLNLNRMAEGHDPANSIWPWAGGYRPRMVPLTTTYPQIKSGAVITAVDLIRGIGKYAGLFQRGGKGHCRHHDLPGRKAGRHLNCRGGTALP